MSSLHPPLPRSMDERLVPGHRPGSTGDPDPATGPDLLATRIRRPARIQRRTLLPAWMAKWSTQRVKSGT